jgi:hypothetical protein
MKCSGWVQTVAHFLSYFVIIGCIIIKLHLVPISYCLLGGADEEMPCIAG